MQINIEYIPVSHQPQTSHERMETGLDVVPPTTSLRLKTHGITVASRMVLSVMMLMAAGFIAVEIKPVVEVDVF